MTPEGRLQADIIELLTRAGYMVVRINSGGRGNRQASRWYADDGKARNSGVFDLLAMKAGRVLWIDPKATRKPSQGQLDFQAECERRGIACVFVWELEALVDVI